MSAPRPQSFGQFHGQPAAVARLRVTVRAALARKRPHPHTLLAGPPGVGKTTLGACVIPTEMGCLARLVNCAAIEKPQDLLPVLTTCRPGSVLFLDEVHRLPAVVAEHLYTVLEDSTVTVVLGDANNRQPMTIELEPFTVIAATTREGLLPAPLRDRFMQQITLELYSDSDMSTVLNWTAQAQDIALSPEAAKALVPACHGTARHAVALIGACIDTIYSEDVVDKPLITTAVARQTLQRLGFTADGLSTREVKLLRVLAAAPGPVGLATVADLLDEEPETIEDVYEPYLLRAGYLARSPKGRVITPMGKAAVC